MKELIKKEVLTKEEINLLEDYFDDSKMEELMEVDNKDIIRFIEKTEEIIGFSMCKNNLDFFLSGETIDCKIFLDETKMDYYNKILELIDYFSITDYGLAYTIGDYFYNENNKVEALKYYKMNFKKGFDLGHVGYFYSLERYLKLSKNNIIDELKELIKFSERDGKYSLDFVDTYLLLIINLEKFSDEYIKYINDAIEVAIPVAREVQKYTSEVFSDSDEERDLCELLALKMEYYVYKKDNIKAFEMYKQLTEEIGRSDCTRYYHARDKFYYDILKNMSNEYPELKFFDNLGYARFKILGNDIDLSVGKEILLQDKNGLEFKFVIVHIYEKNDFTIAPILPLLGEGGVIFTTLITENNELYLENKLYK